MRAVYFTGHGDGWETWQRDGMNSITDARRWASRNGAFRLIVEHANGFISGHVRDHGTWRERSLGWVMPERYWYERREGSFCLMSHEKAARRIFATARNEKKIKRHK